MLYSKNLKRTLIQLSLLAATLGVLPATVSGQIYVANEFNNTIGEYNLDGSTVNASLVSGLVTPLGLAVSGGDIFVANYEAGPIGEYTTSGATVNASLFSLGGYIPLGLAVTGGDIFVTQGNNKIGEYTTSGTTVNASLVTGLNGAVGIAVSGGDIYVANEGNGTIGEYDATTGATINAALVSGLNVPFGLAVSGGNIYVANVGNNTIGEYTTAGATVNTSLVSGLNGPHGLAVSGGTIYVAQNNGTIGEYTTSGATVNTALVSGLSNPAFLDVEPTPEPSTLALAGLGAASLLAFRRRKPACPPGGWQYEFHAVVCVFISSNAMQYSKAAACDGFQMIRRTSPPVTSTELVTPEKTDDAIRICSWLHLR